MFERATLISAIFVFIVFGIVGYKYYQLTEAKSQAPLTLFTE